MTRLGLRAISQLASSTRLDKLGLRKPTEQMLYQGSKMGFRGVTAANRTFKAMKGLTQPARLSRSGPGEMFDLRPSDDQVMICDAVRIFAKEQFRPVAQAMDTAYGASADLLAQCNDLGVTVMGIPESLGGAGTERSAITNVLIAEAMAEGDMGLAFAALAPSAVSTALVLWGSAEQQASYLGAFAGDTPPAAALAVQEPRGLFDPFKLETRARLVNGRYVVDGVKSMVPLAARAELFIVAADIEGRGPGLLIIESSTPGLSIKAETSMGLRAAATAQLVMEGVSVPTGALLGGGAAEVYNECIQLSRLGWCALGTGCAQSVLDYLIPYVNEREAFGEPISHRQSVAFTVSDIAIDVSAMRLLTWQAASLVDTDRPYEQAVALARRYCGDQGARIGSNGVQLLGGHGFVKEHPVERWYRDLRAVGLMEGALLV